MGIIQLIRYTRGVVRFQVRDGHLERFINLCAQGGVPIWDGKRSGLQYTACTTVAGSKRLQEFASKSGTTLETLTRRGVPPLLRRYRKRVGLLVGVLLLLGAMGAMGNFVWQIQLSGLETLSPREVLDTLEELGVHQGVWRGSIDTRDVERQMMIRLDQLAWVGVNLRGSTAYVELKERVPPPPRIDDTVPHNVVASRTGYIAYLEVYAGQAMVKVGDSVQEGDILVSGIMEDRHGKNRAVHARAKVMAQTEETLTHTVPYRQELYLLKGLERRRALSLYGLRLPLSLGKTPEEPYKREATTRPVPLVSLLVPLTYEQELYFLLERGYRTIDPQEAKDLALRELERMELRELKNKEILERSLTGQEAADSFRLEGRYLCLEDISQEIKIF